MGQFAVMWIYLGRCGWVTAELGRFDVSTGITSKSKSKRRVLSQGQKVEERGPGREDPLIYPHSIARV